MSSPGDAALMRMKKRRNSGKAVEPKQPKKEEPKLFGNTVQACEEGLSPKLTFTKNKFDKDESD